MNAPSDRGGGGGGGGETKEVMDRGKRSERTAAKGSWQSGRKKGNNTEKKKKNKWKDAR
jgi:hypothetical protein